jgi:hypothetical protein
MHNITQRAMVVNGTIQPRPMMYIALTYDHRLIDGREVSATGGGGGHRGRGLGGGVSKPRVAAAR